MSDEGLPEASPPDEFDRYTVVLLVKRPDAPVLPDDEAQRIQRQHLGHFARLTSEGSLLVCGPAEDSPDESWRGLCIYRSGLDKARRLAEMDPAVKAGRFSVIAFTWFTGKGALAPKG